MLKSYKLRAALFKKGTDWVFVRRPQKSHYNILRHALK